MYKRYKFNILLLLFLIPFFIGCGITGQPGYFRVRCKQVNYYGVIIDNEKFWEVSIILENLSNNKVTVYLGSFIATPSSGGEPISGLVSFEPFLIEGKSSAEGIINVSFKISKFSAGQLKLTFNARTYNGREISDSAYANLL